MSILKLKPAYKDYLWGGHRLVEEYNMNYDGDIHTAIVSISYVSSHEAGNCLCSIFRLRKSIREGFKRFSF